MWGMKKDTERATELAKAVRHLRRVDPLLAQAIRAIGPCTMELKGEKTLVQALVRAVAHQQIHGKAAQNILGRFYALYPNGAKKFPDAALIAGTSIEALRGAGFSQSKALAILDIAQAGVDGRVPTMVQAQKLGDEELIRMLVPLRGVGRWTVEMLLMFTLGRIDVLPVDDFGVREGFKILKKKRVQPKPKALAAYGKRWAPYRSIASWYLWRVADGAKKIK